MAFRKAERRKARLRLAMAGPAGSGKTASALLVAFGMTNDWHKIAVIDTEKNSSELYVGSTIGGVRIGEFNVSPIEEPYTTKKYIDAINECEREGAEVIIIDSLTHAWAGEGGLLDQQAAAAAASRSGNSYMAWREITPLHNRLVDTILTSKAHIIATMRSKTEYTLGDDNGKKVPTKVGMAPIQRDGMEYEFTVFLDVSPAHIASASKDRTNLFDGERFKPSPEIGKRLLEWLESGVDAPAPEPTTEQGITEKRWSDFYAAAKRDLGMSEKQVNDFFQTSNLRNLLTTPDALVDAWKQLKDSKPTKLV
jgi:hypothetical protein